MQHLLDMHHLLLSVEIESSVVRVHIVEQTEGFFEQHVAQRRLFAGAFDIIQFGQHPSTLRLFVVFPVLAGIVQGLVHGKITQRFIVAHILSV